MKFFFIVLCFLTSLNVRAQELSKDQMIVYLYNVYYWDKDRDQCLYDKTEELCFEVLEKDSLNKNANYHLGLLYYNEAVFLNRSKAQLSKEDEQKARELLAKSAIYFERSEDERHSSSTTDE